MTRAARDAAPTSEEDGLLRPWDWLPPLRLPVAGRTRRVWYGHPRVHAELRAVDAETLAGYAPAAVAAVCALPGVEWADFNPYTHRLVAMLAEGSAGGRDSVVAVLDRVDEELGLQHAPFERDAPEHPADDEPIARDFLEMAADVVGFTLGAIGRGMRVRPPAVEIDVAAVVAALEGAPRLRGAVEKRMGHPAAELVLTAANAIGQGLAQGPLGPIVDIAHRTNLYGELVARRAAWERREPELCARPLGAGVPAALDARPAPLPPGPVERYADEAWFASLAAFVVALGITQRVERAVAALYAGLPKAARMGREAYASQLARVLSRRGVLVMDASVLRALDRVDTLVVEADVLADPLGVLPAASELLEAAERAGLRVLATSAGQDAGPAGLVDEFVPGERVVRHVRDLQEAGRVVCAIGSRHHELLRVADCSLGLTTDTSTPPWSAHLVGSDDLADGYLLVLAVAVARDVSRMSAQLAIAGAVTGAFLAFGGLVPGSTQRATTAVNVAALASIANGGSRGVAIGRRPLPVRLDATPWHALEVDDVLTRLDSGPGGLAESEAARRRHPPSRPDPAPVTFARAVVNELANPLTPVLAAGAALSASVGSVVDATLVGGVMGLNAFVGGVQRLRVDRAAARLIQTRPRRTVVIRPGGDVTLDATDLGVGDVVRLRAGDAVPADLRILAADALEVDESHLTGESMPVVKDPAPTSAHALAEHRSMLYEGTSVAAGEALAVAVATGSDTQARRALLFGGAPPETGVEARLRSMTAMAIPVALAGAAGVVGAGLLRGRPVGESLAAAVSLAVAAVPEGLPLLASVAQLGAARRLAARQVMVRNARAIEALGRVDVLCADKTGTLTIGRITLHSVSDGDVVEAAAALAGPRRAVLAAALRATPPRPDDGPVAHPTDEAVLDGAAGAGVGAGDGGRGWRPLLQLPFEPTRGYHAVLGRLGDEVRLAVKGAPEVLLPRCSRVAGGEGWCPMDEHTRRRLAGHADGLARRGLRVLAVAEAPGRPGPAPGALDDGMVDDLVLLGFVGLSDPVRATAPAAVADLRRAGVEVVMITGDHPSTAEGVAAELGLLDGAGEVLTGTDLDALDDDALVSRLRTVRVFARVTPAHKVRIVRALQRSGRTIAMTGDGANDAPAIRLAHVGIALGRRSTSAAQEAADLVVVDERIETLVDAVIEGRSMWVSVREAVGVLVGGNLGEILFTVVSSVATGRSPLNARQLLLVNLLTDAAPAMAIALRPPPDLRPEALAAEGPDASLGRALDEAIVWRAAATATGAGIAWLASGPRRDPARSGTVALVALVGTQLGQTVLASSRDPLVLAAGLGSAALLGVIVQTPGLSQLFGCRPLGPYGWAVGIGSSVAATAGARLLVPAAPRLLEGLARLLPASGTAAATA